MKRKAMQPDPAGYPEALWEFMKDAPVFDSSCSKEAQVLFLDKDGGFFLKKAPEGALRAESLMTGYMHSLGMSAEVLYYGPSRGSDFLLTRKLPGEDCTHPDYLSQPERLCDTTAVLLRALHETPAENCPVRDRVQVWADRVAKGADGRCYEPELFRGIWEFPSFREARRAAEEGLPLLKTEVLLHGDYCLPNILLDRWKFSGFIDLGDSGMGDRHMDILWGVWTLMFNLGTPRYTRRFLDAYGRDRIEPEMLRMAAAMEMVGV